MNTLFKKILPFLIVLPCFFLVPLIYGWDSALLQWRTSAFGNTYLVFSPFNYLSNIGYSISIFSNSVAKFSNLTLNFNGVINPFISICNCVIAVLNVILVPMSLISNLLILIFALFGFPCNDSNFIFSALYVGTSVQLPYLAYV